jgi:pyruvate/2-oxoacid:ferredoxin oxidoreductase beta subunit
MGKRHPAYKYFQSEDLLTPGAATCRGCALELTVRSALKILGEDIIFFRSAGCSAVLMATTPQGASVKTGSCVSLMTNVPAVATGVSRYLRRTNRDLTCVVFGGDGLTADVGFQSLSGAAERGENLLYICLDNEAYMNTGIQRSSTTPFASWTTTTPSGKNRKGKDIPLIMISHGISYVATASISYPEDFAQKILKAKAVKDGMAYIHTLCPCVVGWRAKEDSCIELGKLAVKTNYFPLWEYERGTLRFTHEIKRQRPLEEFTRVTRRFSNLTSSQLEELQESVNAKIMFLQKLSSENQEMREDTNEEK